MASSVRGVGEYTAVRPMNYTVSNRSGVSEAYTESMKQVQNLGAFQSVDAVNPVQYANARSYTRVDSTSALESAQKANREFNSVAAGFAGALTGYGSDSVGYGYELVGSNIDLYA